MPIKDVLTSPLLTTGERLKRDLGLRKFQYAYIQKVLNFPKSAYIVTVDSRFPSVHISYSTIRTLKSTYLSNLNQRGTSFENKEFKLTPPINLKDFSGGLSRDSFLMFRDLAGEYYMNKNMYTESTSGINIPVIQYQEKENA